LEKDIGFPSECELRQEKNSDPRKGLHFRSLAPPAIFNV